MPPPTQMGQAQVLQMPQQPVERDLGAPPPANMPTTMEVMQATNAQQQAIMAAVSAIQQAGPVAGGAVSSSLSSLEATLARLEESFNFAVECMQTDMQECKKSLAELKLQLGA